MSWLTGFPVRPSSPGSPGGPAGPGKPCKHHNTLSVQGEEMRSSGHIGQQGTRGVVGIIGQQGTRGVVGI